MKDENMTDGTGGTDDQGLPHSPSFLLPPSSFCLRVVKLGGSLLDFDALVPALRSWLAGQPAMTTVMVVGGGSLADAIRDAHVRQPLDDEAAHWLCIRLLGVTAELVARLLPEARLIPRLGELFVGRTSVRSGGLKSALQQEGGPRPRDAGLWILEPESFLRDEELRIGAKPLPHTWGVTSDSIAARLAVALEATELVLLKSRLPDGAEIGEAVRTGYVDAYFSRAVVGTRAVRCVNLRAVGFPQVEMRIPGSQEDQPQRTRRSRRT
jgi:hypothetical protein